MKYIAEENELVDLLLTPKEIEDQWERFLDFMTQAHREKYPEDEISTPDLCEVFMQRLLRRGLIEQDGNGVYQLCPLIMSN